MKKISILAVAVLVSVMSYAQHQVNSFFDDMGIIRLETQELLESSDTMVNVTHRADDVVWSRVVYRIVDMRLKQNYQLYTPVTSEDPQYSSLFRTMLRAIEHGMPVYEKSNTVGDIKPYFNFGEMPKELIPTILNTVRPSIAPTPAVRPAATTAATPARVAPPVTCARPSSVWTAVANGWAAT